MEPESLFIQISFAGKIYDFHVAKNSIGTWTAESIELYAEGETWWKAILNAMEKIK